MSGGSHDYIYSRIEEAADLIRDVVAEDDCEEGFEPPLPVTVEEHKFAALLDECAKVMYALEWWRSGDTSRKDFLKAYNKLNKKLPRLL